jgi:uncharacterized membrane protein
MIWVLPIITGVSSTLWAYLLKSSPGGFWLAYGAEFISKIFLFGFLYWVLKAPTVHISNIVIIIFIVEVLLTAVISVLWCIPIIYGFTYPTVALSEIAYPLFAVLTAYLLFKGEQLTVIQIIGGIIVISGALLVTFGAKTQ